MIFIFLSALFGNAPLSGFAGVAALIAVTASILAVKYSRSQKSMQSILLAATQTAKKEAALRAAAEEDLNKSIAALNDARQLLTFTEAQRDFEKIRGRLSRESHDDISSDLSRILWMSELARAKLKKDTAADVSASLEKINTCSRQTVAKLADIIWAVNPENDSLGSMLSYIRNFSAMLFADTGTQLIVDFTGEMELLLNPELKRNIFLTCKEAMTNAAMHAQATTVQLSFSLAGGRYNLSVADNGVGAAQSAIDGGEGIALMRKRMAAVNGGCTINTGAGKGTEVMLSGIVY